MKVNGLDATRLKLILVDIKPTLSIFRDVTQDLLIVDNNKKKTCTVKNVSYSFKSTNTYLKLYLCSSFLSSKRYNSP